MKEEKDIPVNLGWWRYNQIKDLFSTDKSRYGFKEEYTEIEEALIGGKEKLISKLYKILLRWYMEEGTVKVQMIRWAEDVQKYLFRSLGVSLENHSKSLYMYKTSRKFNKNDVQMVHDTRQDCVNVWG